MVQTNKYKNQNHLQGSFRGERLAKSRSWAKQSRILPKSALSLKAKGAF